MPYLKPCPFCGGEPRSGGFRNPVTGYPEFAVSCSRCGVAFEERSEMLAVTKWNTRVKKDIGKGIDAFFHGEN